MKTKTIKIELSVADYADLQDIADACAMSVAEVVQQCVKRGMPPILNKVPDAFHAELLFLHSLKDRQLFDVIEGKLPPKGKQTELHKKADFESLRRTYALSLLRWRGHPVPDPFEAMIG